MKFDTEIEVEYDCPFRFGLLNVSERLKGSSKDRYHLDALSYLSRDDWVLALDALRFNCIVAALQRNDPELTSVHPFTNQGIDGITAEGVIALCSALEVNSFVQNLELKNFEMKCGASLSRMLMLNSSLVKAELSGEKLIES